MMSTHETYYPKALARFTSKSASSLTLKSVSMDASLKLLSGSELGSGNGRDARGRKSFRRFLDETLPRELQTDLIEKGVERWFGAEKMLNLMNIFEPKRAISDSVDLIGSFRYAYGCYYCSNKLFWSNGTIERLNLNMEQCNQLHRYISWSDAIKKKQLRSVVISTERNALGNSNLPNIFAQSSSLTSITLLNGATNHTLRIIGLHCPQLRILDVSHSASVNDFGLAGLLLLKKSCSNGSRQNAFHGMTSPVQARAILPEEKNKCAFTLCKIVLIGTDVSHFAFNIACVILHQAYYLAFLPDLMIVRPLGGRATFLDGGIQPLSAKIETNDSLVPIFGQDEAIIVKMNTIMTRFVERRHGTEGSFQVLDHFSIPERGFAQNFLRGVDSFITEAMIGTLFKANTFKITQLILSWDSFTWSINSLPDLTELGVCLPNLVVLKARLQGVWGRKEKLFPQLRETYIWTVSDCTVLSFLRFCPRIQTFKFNCLDLIRSNVVLTDDNFQRSLTSNPSLLKTLTEVCIRPASNLHISSAQFLLEQAKRLRRLGDMESWKVSPEEIKQLNEELDKMNSKCVLTVLSFPPRKKHQYLL